MTFSVMLHIWQRMTAPSYVRIYNEAFMQCTHLLHVSNIHKVYTFRWYAWPWSTWFSISYTDWLVHGHTRNKPLYWDATWQAHAMKMPTQHPAAVVHLWMFVCCCMPSACRRCRCWRSMSGFCRGGYFPMRCHNLLTVHICYNIANKHTHTHTKHELWYVLIIS